MLGLIFLNSRIGLAIIFFNTFVWIPLFRVKEAILGVASVFRLASLPEMDSSRGGTLLVRRYEELQRSDDRTEEEEMCSICLTEFAREDSVCKLPDCAHVFHFDCIEKWHERNRFTCPLCRCFFNIEKHHERKLRFVVPDNPSSLYYFLQ
ncbi:RING-H2 finger protein ATL18-like [Cucurbita pepo subsp. pepo]|uniref:RING-H2 finger protein ATL18-like n=1 Tax=Cucurbita pepo subsp. pepo TaxID=3664 RepID=UPI000C9D9B35|nr:RING-H2 finger protein ATL18-like [Cucurbita pepo subsp. pepo]